MFRRGCLHYRYAVNRKAAKHVVVEANPYLIPWLFKNRHRNDAKFVVEFCAIAEEAHTTFNLNDRIDRGSIQQEGSSSVSVPCRTVKDLERKHGAFNALVMDIQGAEIDVMKMTGDILNNYRLLIIEWHESITGAQAVKDYRAILQRCGFTLSRQSVRLRLGSGRPHEGCKAVIRLMSNTRCR
ncbi:MAG: FkbM family methyltransferase [Planctomycetota bacterium]